jgi:hypothetical protein
MKLKKIQGDEEREKFELEKGKLKVFAASLALKCFKDLDKKDLKGGELSLDEFLAFVQNNGM